MICIDVHSVKVDKNKTNHFMGMCFIQVSFRHQLACMQLQENGSFWEM